MNLFGIDRYSLSALIFPSTLISSSTVFARSLSSLLLCFGLMLASLSVTAAGDKSQHKHSPMHSSSASTQVPPGSETLMVPSTETLTIADPVQIYQPLPGKNMSAGYPMIANEGQQSRQLLSVAASWAERIEIHTHQHKFGMMKMVKLDSLKIKAGKSAQFKPGGLHLMIFGVQQPLPENLSMTFCFDDNQCLEQVVEVIDY